MQKRNRREYLPTKLLRKLAGIRRGWVDIELDLAEYRGELVLEASLLHKT